jgi:glycosyltransferase involved in cell wall biosynthesis
MKILIYSPAFLPQVGGLELSTAQLAEGLQGAGHEVVVVTRTASSAEETAAYRVVRRPRPLALLALTRWCDVFFQANVSLRGLWPLLLIARPWVVAHHSWYCRSDGRVALPDHLKRWLLRFAAGSIAVSEAVAADLGGHCTVIPNAYRDQLFRQLTGVKRDRELLFVGRLVSDKGVDVLLSALSLLGKHGPHPSLTVVGEGPEGELLTAQAARDGLDDRVTFVGTRTGDDLVTLMNRHRVLVVPSRYREPFGIVALEGIACGCVVVGSEGGGLPEAIGACGLTFRNGDPADLARALTLACGWSEEERRRRLAGAGEHLPRHSSPVVLARYLEVLEQAASRRRSARKSMAPVA